jgi:hypothetical protein
MLGLDRFHMGFWPRFISEQAFSILIGIESTFVLSYLRTLTLFLHIPCLCPINK